MTWFCYTPNCTEDCRMVLEPVPGAERWPRRIVCETHGYPTERRTNLGLTPPDADPPNDYVSEIASPADIQEIGGNQISTY